MSEKTFKRVLLALGGLVVIYLVVSLAGRRGPSDGASDETAVAIVLAAVDTANLEIVAINSTTVDVELRRGASGWTVNDLPADSTAIARLLAAIADASVGDLVSDNPSNHARLHVVEDSALALTFESGADARLLIGKAGPGASAYVRVPGASEVFLVDGLRAAASRGMTEWRDRVVATLDTAAASRITVTRDGERSELVREDAYWVLADGAAPDSATVRNLLRDLARLSATGFPPDSVSMPDASARVVALGARGDTLLVLDLAVPDSAADWLATTPRRPGEIFTLPAYRVELIAPPRTKLTGDAGG